MAAQGQGFFNPAPKPPEILTHLFLPLLHTQDGDPYDARTGNEARRESHAAIILRDDAIEHTTPTTSTHCEFAHKPEQYGAERDRCAEVEWHNEPEAHTNRGDREGSLLLCDRARVQPLNRSADKDAAKNCPPRGHRNRGESYPPPPLLVKSYFDHAIISWYFLSILIISLMVPFLL